MGVFNGNLPINASQDFSCQVTVGAAGSDTAWSADGHGLDAQNNPVPDTNEHQQGSIHAINPGVSIVKYTNGADANDPNAAGVPDISAGGAVMWRYDITNTGQTPVAAADVAVTDNVTGVTPSCAAAAAADANHVFDPGETWQCTATGTALDLTSPNPPAGTHIVANSCSQGGARTPSNAYTNLGTVTIPGATASDPSSYCNPPRKPGVSIVKYTNGADANDPNAAGVPDISAGGAVMWRYDITNTGQTPVAAADVAVTDNVTGVTPSCAAAAAADANHVFDPGETWQCTATGTALDLTSPNPPAGTHIVANSCSQGGARTPSNAYTNLGTVTIPGATATDPSSYCNPPRKPGVSIVKYTNGADANDPNAAGVPDISAGGAVMWRYDITNTGQTPVAAADVAVTDNVTGVTPSCAAAAAADANHVFDPGETWQCTATGTALDLTSANPPAGTHIVANSCTQGGARTPSNAYTNLGTVTIPGATASDPSSYCNPPQKCGDHHHRVQAA